MANGRIEAQITAAAWSMNVTITAIGGPFGVSITSGTYFMSGLLQQVADKLNAASGADGVFTVTAATGEGGTGLVTIAHTIETFSLTWTDTDLRDVLGFAGDLTPAALTFTGTSHLRGVWLPTYSHNAPRGLDPGFRRFNRSELVASDGSVSSLVYGSGRTVLPRIEWPIVERRRALITGEVTTGESYERWLRDVYGGERTYFVTNQVRFYWDADDVTSTDFYLTGNLDTNLQRGGDGTWIEIWTVAIEGFEVP